jgi:VanZ family protein
MTISSNRSVWRGRLFRYAPLFLWTLVVLGLSTGQASMSETSLIIGPILKFLFPAAPDETIAAYHGFIRKCAHFTEYAILAALAVRAFAGSASFPKRHPFLASLVLVVLVAGIDEFNQSLNQARTGSIRDVMLDCLGGATVVAVIYIFTVRGRRPAAR